MQRILITLGLIVSIGAIAQTSSSSKETSKTRSSFNSTSAESSITRSKESYRFDAAYDKEKNEAVRELLTDRLGTSYLEVRGGTYEWAKERSGKEFFSCVLRDKQLHLSLNREMASDDFYDLIDELGDDLRDLIQGHTPLTWTPRTPKTPMTPSTPSNPNSADPQLYEDELRQAERELARAQRNLERLKKKKN